MKLYITAVFVKGMAYMAFAMNGKTFGMIRSYKVSTARKDILEAAVKNLKDYLRHRPNENGERHILYQDIVLNRKELSCIMEKWKETFPGGISRYENYLPFPGEHLFARVYYPKEETAYRFKEGDLVIARWRETDTTSEVALKKNQEHGNYYARVLSVDYDNDHVILDEYLMQGRISTGKPKEYPLLTTELHAWYEPMLDEDIVCFHQGLNELFKDSDTHKYPKIQSPEIFRETCEKVEEAVRKLKEEN